MIPAHKHAAEKGATTTRMSKWRRKKPQKSSKAAELGEGISQVEKPGKKCANFVELEILQNEYLPAKIGFDRAENEPFKC